ncbi:long-chain-fatty-acid--CoA ligase [Aneurinibacillus aneurinilyticus]|jgi:fatty-acyl-CoA synthase|uniref:Putative CoA ligase n=1 Tax=Aneurinibacillus aneurinilyticus ATCC 12856 TaxID=649747 RepID=U1X6A9_ANEAE|nr:long-chain-fatty-acid--CoA ligase [Aneurinibacillus aneurinilyticus]ERI10510.1 putative CoA ligase [Aneurinibacillus aneurinilyticus ATCC 12856]MCI1693741.1 long-chain-fatty-acid--CoA ligase [Aneurinibacillus aneurinilyticus]MED0709064.1 long-chain-fatty-acid--CoA ligase [Aneurinibacillus aneurinilyticus]MED0725458.1 long-chain-fatty-acid--CoA ligase [Aneurinibacillus aneurinilyticus]MED0730769.1 long-chain-fatty-acid--CoA ligase [Aneurinibacillus aneurinilyticus]
MYVPLLLQDFLKRAVYHYPQKTAVIDGERRLTYAEIETRVNRLANAFRSNGIVKGDRIAVLSPNRLEMYEAFYAAFLLGAVIVPLNTRLMPADYEYIINHSGAKMFLVDAELAQLIEPVKTNLTNVKHYVSLQVEGFDNRNGWLIYDAMLESASPAPVYEDVDERDMATILYTSGTTGRPKGVVQTHRSLYMNAINTIIHTRAEDEDILLHTLPMFHVNGWGTPFSFTGMGATHVMLRKIDAAHIVHLVETEGITVACMAPTVLNMILNEPAAKTTNIRQNVRVVIAGSAPPPSFVKAVEQELGWTFLQVYGMTEVAPFITVGHIKKAIRDEGDEERIHRLKAKAGISMINVEARVINEDGEDVKPDGQEVGEVICRSNSVMDGYWLQPEETARSIINGWYHTGDMATIDENGYIDIVDRKKDIIISGGENISSIEVEGTLYEHPDILEAAIIAVPHEKWGEVPHAVCVLHEDANVTEEQIISFCRERMAHFKCPKSVQFVTELPKTASGKIQKVVLREPFWKKADRLVN